MKHTQSKTTADILHKIQNIEKGVRGFIDFVRETLTGPWLDIDWVQARLKQPYQLRLI